MNGLKVKEVDVSLIRKNKIFDFDYDSDDVDALINSIQRNGQLEPCVVYEEKSKNDKYEYTIVNGSKRLLALKKLIYRGFKNTKIIIRVLDEKPVNVEEEILLWCVLNRDNIPKRPENQRYNICESLMDLYVEYKKNNKLKNVRKREFVGEKMNLSPRRVQDLITKINKDEEKKVIRGKKEVVYVNGHYEQKRNPTIKLNILEKAKYQCEYDCNHKCFPNSSGEHNYVEGHHLIPLSYYYLFEDGLDVEANIVCLCVNCHAILHKGNLESKIPILRKLYDLRIDDLRKAGLDISFEKLVSLYK